MSMRAFLLWLYRHSRAMRHEFATREQYLDLAQQLHDATRRALEVVQMINVAHEKELMFERQMARKNAERYRLAGSLMAHECEMLRAEIAEMRKGYGA